LLSWWGKLCKSSQGAWIEVKDLHAREKVSLLRALMHTNTDVLRQESCEAGANWDWREAERSGQKVGRRNRGLDEAPQRLRRAKECELLGFMATKSQMILVSMSLHRLAE
jgi:hypothetical protein